MREGWRYCRLREKSKLPLEKDWLNKCTDDIETVRGWILNGDNVGLVYRRDGSARTSAR